MRKFRLLKADEIEVKIKQVTEKGAVALIYKTSRVDMDILDETVGAENWQSEYSEIKGNLYCGIGIRDDVSGWVWKSDCGIESRSDGEGNEKKGEASDAFKRAGVQWGIGRELYTAPFIFLNLPTTENQNGKGYKLKNPFAKFDVSEIGYDDGGRITKLVIVDENKKTVYSYPKKSGQTSGPGRTETPKNGEVPFDLGEDYKIKPSEWMKIGYNYETLNEVSRRNMGKDLDDLSKSECNKMREWIEKVYQKRLKAGLTE